MPCDLRYVTTPCHCTAKQRLTCFLANQFHTSSDFPVDYPARQRAEEKRPAGSDAPEIWSRGGSCIVGPLGEVLAGPLWEQEGILQADVSDQTTTFDS